MSEFITEEGKEVLAKYDAVIVELVKILTPHIQAYAALRPYSIVELVKLLTPHIKKVVVAEIIDNNETISALMEEMIETRCNKLGLVNEDRVEELIKYYEPGLDLDGYKFRNAVKDCVRDMNFKIEVD